MPNIDTSVISGFESMSDADKVSALLKLDIPEKIDLSGYVEKKTFDAKASEAAELSKKLKGKLTEDEAAEAARLEELNALKAQMQEITEANQKLQQEKLEAGYKAKYLSMPGFDEKLAEETAKAMASGDMDKVFANQQKASAEHEKQVRAELTKQDPKPGGKGGPGEEKSEAERMAETIGKRKSAALTAGAGLDKFKLK